VGKKVWELELRKGKPKSLPKGPTQCVEFTRQTAIGEKDQVKPNGVVRSAETKKDYVVRVIIKT